MVAGKLVAHLVRHVVDRIKISNRSRNTGAAAGFVRTTDNAEVSDTTSRLAEGEMADVVITGADDLTDDEARTVGTGTTRDLRLREAASRTARSIWPYRLVPGV